MPSSRGSPNPGIEPRSPALQANALPSEPPRKPKNSGVGCPVLLQWIFWPRNQTGVSCIAGGFFISSELPGKPITIPLILKLSIKSLLPNVNCKHPILWTPAWLLQYNNSCTLSEPSPLTYCLSLPIILLTAPHSPHALLYSLAHINHTLLWTQLFCSFLLPWHLLEAYTQIVDSSWK